MCNFLTGRYQKISQKRLLPLKINKRLHSPCMKTHKSHFAHSEIFMSKARLNYTPNSKHTISQNRPGHTRTTETQVTSAQSSFVAWKLKTFLFAFSLCPYLYMVKNLKRPSSVTSHLYVQKHSAVFLHVRVHSRNNFCGRRLGNESKKKNVLFGNGRSPLPLCSQFLRCENSNSQQNLKFLRSVQVSLLQQNNWKQHPYFCQPQTAYKNCWLNDHNWKKILNESQWRKIIKLKNNCWRQNCTKILTASSRPIINISKVGDSFLISDVRWGKFSLLTNVSTIYFCHCVSSCSLDPTHPPDTKCTHRQNQKQEEGKTNAAPPFCLDLMGFSWPHLRGQRLAKRLTQALKSDTDKCEPQSILIHIWNLSRPIQQRDPTTQEKTEEKDNFSRSDEAFFCDVGTKIIQLKN